MTEAAAPSSLPFYKIGLIVTGKGEEQFLPELLRALTHAKTCHFQVMRRISQRSPITSKKRRPSMVGTAQQIPTKDEEEIALPARRWLGKANTLLLLIDDLEHDRRGDIRDVFGRYRTALDMLLSEEQKARASVHFLVNMLEAYYFADADAVNAVLGTSLVNHAGDVETIPHPKNKLKTRYPGFDEVKDGQAIIRQLDVEHILDNPQTCAALRVLFGWCVQATGGAFDARFRLDTGVHDVVTDPQLGPRVHRGGQA